MFLDIDDDVKETLYSLSEGTLHSTYYILCVQEALEKKNKKNANTSPVNDDFSKTFFSFFTFPLMLKMSNKSMKNLHTSRVMNFTPSLSKLNSILSGEILARIVRKNINVGMEGIFDSF